MVAPGPRLQAQLIKHGVNSEGWQPLRMMAFGSPAVRQPRTQTSIKPICGASMAHNVLRLPSSRDSYCSVSFLLQRAVIGNIWYQFLLERLFLDEPGRIAH